eukprot:CAMPEP_0181249988 /NCGR_PEP_ID=MMETSP1096-20121128/46066_1 /TAXON_ID=156174 ORGANISM="Chrysochromulina ericina, Strain CCMP281" /NCGR_SAMPLE_ID=MMETSP1096 /ASSEMBLY_ACC=CAM_ASM_000453 /LENGTH=127 /DNA_ID=CAMNT_0023347399 /DNA_START=340 /DNA_END=719 /DNA_ORIENTATION=-
MRDASLNPATRLHSGLGYCVELSCACDDGWSVVEVAAPRSRLQARHPAPHAHGRAQPNDRRPKQSPLRSKKPLPLQPTQKAALHAARCTLHAARCTPPEASSPFLASENPLHTPSYTHHRHPRPSPR